MKNIFTLTATLLSFASCSLDSDKRPKFRAKSCVKEINRSYASIGKTPGSIYKLDEIVKSDIPQIKVSFWHNNSWFYQGMKNYNHFESTSRFEYEKIDCPDGSDKEYGITDKLKKIDI